METPPPTSFREIERLEELGNRLAAKSSYSAIAPHSTERREGRSVPGGFGVGEAKTFLAHEARLMEELKPPNRGEKEVDRLKGRDRD